MRLRWKKVPKEPGLSRYIAGPQESKLHDGTKEYAYVSAIGGGWRRTPVVSWYWVAFGVGEYKNTCNEPCAEEADAKAQAMAFVKARLAEKRAKTSEQNK